MWRREIFSVIVPCTNLWRGRGRTRPASGPWPQANEPTTAAPTARRDKPWIFRTYAGHSTARESNRLYRQNLAKGQTGLSIAFDLPTQTGFDSDHPLARGEVGKVGVAISHIGDMRALFEDIPLASMNTSMTINATAPWLMALYIAVADEQGAPRAELQGTTQNDIIKEYLARGAYVFPPDAVAPADQGPDPLLRPRDAEVEPDERVLLPFAGSRRDAGAGAFATRSPQRSPCSSGCANRARSTRRVSPRSSARISFFVNAGMRFVTELAKMRAFVELWDEITRDRFGVQDPPKRRFRYGVQVNSLGPDRAAAGEQRLSHPDRDAVGGPVEEGARARAVQLPAWNEALGLPRPFDQQWSLRLQQIMAYETDLLEFGDIFDGSKEIAALVDEAQSRGAGRDRRDRRDGRRGPAIETGVLKAKPGRIEYPPARGDRARRADRRRRQRFHQFRALAADRRRELDHGSLGRGRGGADRKPQRLARGPRSRAGQGGAASAAPGGGERREHHARFDRGRQGRRHDRRMGRRAARRIRRVPRPDRRFAQGSSGVGRS